MTDKELLVLAAKAADIELWHEDVFTKGLTQKISQSGILCWNPLTDDGDALRLAVACGIAVTPYPIYEWPKHSVVAARRSIESSSTEVVELYGENPDVATRRAITRAAAEIGKAKCE
jgi:hypothetical protein